MTASKTPANGRRKTVTSARLTLGPKVGKFFETYLTHPKGYRYGQPFILEPFQQEFLNEFYRVDERGKRVYRLGILGVPRGNGKTPLAAGVGLFELMARQDAPDVFNASGSEDQARVLTEFARSFVLDGKLQNWLDAQRKVITHRTTKGVLRVIPSSGRLQHGLSVSAAIADELHAFTTEEQEEVWTALWTAMHKRENAFGLIITTAGYDLQTLLGRMYTDALKLDREDREFVESGPCLRICRDEHNGILFWWYGPPEQLGVEEAVADQEIWRKVNPASWVSIRDLEQQLAAPGFDEYDFARLHLNMWTATRETFIPLAQWQACKRPDVKLERKKHIFVGVDVGITHDTTAVGWSQAIALDEVGLDVKINEKAEPTIDPWGQQVEPSRAAVVSRVRVWSANPEHERDRTQRHVWVPGGRVDLEMVEEFILELAGVFIVKELVYDPVFFEGEAQRLAKRGVRLAPMFQAGMHPQTAAQQWYADIKEGRALHPGDPVLDRHVAAAAGIKTERGWRMSKLHSTSPIDAGVAVSWSHWRASRSIGSVYDERDLVMLQGDPDEGMEWIPTDG